jgi:ubiquinone/menaquinone biosynthesis C-methylase UbiE
VEFKLNETNIILTKKNIKLNHHFDKIKGPIFIGRTWKEYLKMFNLNSDDMVGGKLLDCAAGASSFTAEMSKRGYDVKAVDILYNEEADVLCDKCYEHMEVLVDGLESVDHFVWSFFSDLDDLKEQRNHACSEFIQDYRNHRKRYIAADLTHLPFEDNSFKMVLCSHLLFIYDHRLDYEFHLKSIKEMLRVSSSELRIYPLVKNRGMKSEFVKRIINDLHDVDADIVKVDYEFRKGGNEMIKIRK